MKASEEGLEYCRQQGREAGRAGANERVGGESEGGGLGGRETLLRGVPAHFTATTHNFYQVTLLISDTRDAHTLSRVLWGLGNLSIFFFNYLRTHVCCGGWGI